MRNSKPILHRFSPIRRRDASRLFYHLASRGGKLRLEPQVYDTLKQTGLHAHQVDLAIDDLFQTGMVQVRCVGDIGIVQIRPLQQRGGRR